MAKYDYESMFIFIILSINAFRMALIYFITYKCKRYGSHIWISCDTFPPNKVEFSVFSCGHSHKGIQVSLTKEICNILEYNAISFEIILTLSKKYLSQCTTSSSYWSNPFVYSKYSIKNFWVIFFSIKLMIFLVPMMSFLVSFTNRVYSLSYFCLI